MTSRQDLFEGTQPVFTQVPPMVPRSISVIRAPRSAAFSAAAMARNPNVRIEPAWKVSHLYGMPCAFYHQLPAAWYLAARFNDDFENAVLHAINGGGQNQSQAMLTGALVGLAGGLAGIPQRLLDGLERADELQQLAHTLASQMQT